MGGLLIVGVGFVFLLLVLVGIFLFLGGMVLILCNLCWVKWCWVCLKWCWLCGGYLVDCVMWWFSVLCCYVWMMVIKIGFGKGGGKSVCVN